MRAENTICEASAIIVVVADGPTDHIQHPHHCISQPNQEVDNNGPNLWLERVGNVEYSTSFSCLAAFQCYHQIEDYEEERQAEEYDAENREAGKECERECDQFDLDG